MKFPEQFRWKDAPHGYHTEAGERQGIFNIPASATRGRSVKVIASNGDVVGWEHVSVTLAERRDRCPSWDEMCAVKSLFWDDTETLLSITAAVLIVAALISTQPN